MDKKPSLKEMLYNLLTHFEDLQFECWALKSILKTCPFPYTKETWERDLKRFFADEELRARAHEKFEPLYAQIEAATDEKAVLELLSRIPLSGKVN